jgi:hypothetical protein
MQLKCFISKSIREIRLEKETGIPIYPKYNKYRTPDDFIKDSKNRTANDLMKKALDWDVDKLGLKNLKTITEEKGKKIPFISLVSYVVLDKDLQIVDKFVYGILKGCVNYSNKKGYKGRCFISIEEIAKMINISIRAVKRSLKRLSENCWIAWKPGHKNRSNEYLIFNKRQHDLLLKGCTNLDEIFK